MPSFNIQENVINQNYLANIKTALNTEDSWVGYSKGKCDFSNQRENAKSLTCTIQNCTHLVNKLFSTIYLSNDDRDILPPTYYLINSKWIGPEPENNTQEWIMKDVWDYSENNCQTYSTIEECLITSLMDKYYVVQNYIPKLDLVRCYLLLYRNEFGTQFYLFKDGYFDYENNNDYYRFKSHDNYYQIYNKIKSNIEKHLSSLSNSINKKTETNLQEFQVFEYLFGVNNDNCYLLNCSIQLSIYEKENKVFNILANIITNDIVTGIIKPVLDYTTNKEDNIDETVNQLVNETVTKFMDTTVNIPDNQSVDALDETIVEETVDELSEKTAEKPTEETAEEIVEEIANKLVEDTIEDLVSVPQQQNDIIIMDNSRWDRLIPNTELKEISKMFLEVIKNSKKKIYKLSNARINTYTFENKNSNNIIMGIQKILEGQGDWKESKKDIGLSDTTKSVIKYGMNLTNYLNMDNARTLLPTKYIPEIYNSYSTIPTIDENYIWFIKNITSGEYNITKLLQHNTTEETTIKDDFIMIDKEDILIYQKEIDNLMLINNRKFVIKTYCLLAGNMDDISDIPKLINNVFLNIEGIIFCASADYDETNVNRDIHSFTEISNSPNDISTYALHFSDWNKYKIIYPIICKIITTFFKKLLENVSFNDMSVEVFGFDFMVDNNNKVYLVDIHENPVIMGDKRMWYSSVKTMLTSLLKDIIDMVVIPFLNDNSIEITSRWKKII